jgi:hypothetical protein
MKTASQKSNLDNLTINPDCTVRIIDDSVCPPVWKTIGKCTYAPNPIKAIMKKNGVKMAWVFFLGQKEFFSL